MFIFSFIRDFRKALNLKMRVASAIIYVMCNILRNGWKISLVLSKRWVYKCGGLLFNIMWIIGLIYDEIKKGIEHFDTLDAKSRNTCWQLIFSLIF